MTLKLGHLRQVNLGVSDLGKSVEFYRDTLGADLIAPYAPRASPSSNLEKHGCFWKGHHREREASCTSRLKTLSLHVLLSKRRE